MLSYQSSGESGKRRGRKTAVRVVMKVIIAVIASEDRCFDKRLGWMLSTGKSG
ncbi:hypothetical protein CWATWH8502_1048 [Crocosphaera watsonii WH 8502]|uniref:Uncharacterized protein n=4 Tax=Crocosphaera watsonii TaxID=263511 RepID=G5J8E3_CROWT|nr:hypothetical protein CWATWH0003_3723 [Crocosphaera watsonii WH 0003]CCQ49848.1 hypothetical protein CWATWH8502_1048 [Crocosphaera watsonii WH 8502]CCQ56275.1 hypothetical protein CWATWH0005_3121 [Crocosphaera watsonii WH 0005]CCQ60452.1 hypothetical protein CWATWH0401_4298 [Crocosphaera watsonii WH 0401]